MTWKIDDPTGAEALKVIWDTVPYTRGRGLDIGCGPSKVWPHAIGIDSLKEKTLFGIDMDPDVILPDAAKIDMFASQSMDWVFSSHLLEHIDNHVDALYEWWRVIRPGGYLILYLPHKDFYPNCHSRDKWEEWLKEHEKDYGSEAQAAIAYAAMRKENGAATVGEQYAGTPCANIDHKHDFVPQDIVDCMEKVGGWDLLANEERGDGKEYSFFQVYKKFTDVKKHRYSYKDPRPEKTCGIVRYGAWGDVIQMSSILPGLKAQGYHITVYTTPRAFEAIQHESLIDRFILQDKDQVPNAWLGDFLKHERKKYDKFLNLCESVEGTYLAMPDRVMFDWSHEARHAHMNRNYIEMLHAMAGVPHERPQMRFVMSEDEKVWVRHEQKKLEASPLIMWVLSGSAVHKVYPHVDPLFARVLLTWPQAKIITCGDEHCRKIIEAPWEKEKRIVKRSGVWTIRQTMAMAQHCDLVVGPETGVMNCVSMGNMPKIVLLSHSSPENLTKGWINTYSLYSADTPCHPCHKMIYTWDQCVREKETGVSLCMASIPPEAVWHALLTALGAKFQMVDFGQIEEAA